MEDFSNPEIKCHIHLYNADYPELHDHDYWEFFIILSGEAEHYVGGQKQLLTSSIGCLVHPCDRHRFVNSSKSFQHLNIGITDKYFKQLLDFVDEKLYDLLSSINHPLIYEIDEDRKSVV